VVFEEETKEQHVSINIDSDVEQELINSLEVPAEKPNYYTKDLFFYCNECSKEFKSVNTVTRHIKD
jgi:hypothetical protein